MSEREIDRIIESSYCMRSKEILAYVEMMKTDPYRALQEIFNCGRTKGYQAAKAEMRRG